jgi:hypothetical protein
VTGVATTYNIGVQLDDGTFQWTTVNGAPSGSTVTLTAVLTDSAAPATWFWSIKPNWSARCGFFRPGATT